MDQRFSVVCDESLARRIDSLSHEYGLSREEVLRQLIAVGIEHIEQGASH